MKKYISFIFLTMTLLLAFSCKEEILDFELQTPRLISVVPQTGYSGCQAIISGIHFSEKAEENIVKIDGIEVPVEKSTSNRLLLTMPSHEDGVVNIEVTCADQAATNVLEFTYATLPEKKINITAVSPERGYVGSIVKIYGENFVTDKTMVKVMFDDQLAEVVSATETMIEVKAPEHELGDAILSLDIDGQQAFGMFRYTQLMIDSNFPISGSKGTKVTIKGEGFSDNLAENTVLVNGKTAEIVSAGVEQIVVIMPENELGTYEFKIVIGDKSVTGGYFKYSGKWYADRVVGAFDGPRLNKPGKGTDARLDLAQDLVKGKDGIYWLTLRGNEHGVYKMDAEYNVTKVVTSTENPILVQSFPWGGDCDSKGTFYFCGKPNGNVFYIDNDGNLNEYQIEGGKFANTMNLVFDKDDNMYIFVRSGSLILKVKDHKIIHRYELSTDLTFEHICLDKTGTKMFILGSTTGYLHMLDLQTEELTIIAGNGANHNKDNYTDGKEGDPRLATMGSSDGAYVAEDGILYFTDVTAKTLRRLVPDKDGDYTQGTIETIIGNPFSSGVCDGIGAEVCLHSPKAVTISNDGQSLLLLDGQGNSTIRKITYKK